MWFGNNLSHNEWSALFNHFIPGIYLVKFFNELRTVHEILLPLITALLKFERNINFSSINFVIDLELVACPSYCPPLESPAAGSL